MEVMQLIERVNINKSKTAAKLLFMIGLFSQLQVRIGGKLGISEIILLAFAPFIFLKGFEVFRRDGSLYYFLLIILWLAGAIFVDVYTDNYMPLAMRGIAVPITVFANSVCIYWLLRKDFENLKWLLLGFAISGVVSIFIFQRGIAGDIAAEQGLEAGMDEVIGYKLFWVFQLTAWLTLPITGWYLKISKTYSVIALLFLAAFNLAMGGRSAFLVAGLSVVLIMLAGKTRRSIEVLKKHAVMVIALLVVLGFGAKYVYKYAATHNYMGEDEAEKYEASTAHGSNALDLIIAGRAEFFIGLKAAFDAPIIGHGSVAIDDHGYILDFYNKYGSNETYNRLLKMRQKFGARIIPAHSHIICYWLWHGLFGLVFWLYVIVLASKTLFFRMHIYPPWFGYFAVTVPAFIWDVLFSPFGARVQESALFVAFLLVAKMQREQMKVKIL